MIFLLNRCDSAEFNDRLVLSVSLNVIQLSPRPNYERGIFVSTFPPSILAEYSNQASLPAGFAYSIYHPARSYCRSRHAKPKNEKAPRPGYFVDLKTLAAALTSRSFNLAGLAEFLKTENRKLNTEDHGKSVTTDYLSYAKQDVQVTWECYCKLLDKYSEHKFTQTAPHRIFSEASVGKAYFKEMKIRPWREMQPDFPDALSGIIMSTYFGGRSEVHHRRIISQVRYCDFLSMYPTVCTLMGLWRFVIASGVNWWDSTGETTGFLDTITLTELAHRNTWPELTTLVQIAPDADVVPIRANYGGDQQSTIGLNYLSSETPVWFTLADCIASNF